MSCFHIQAGAKTALKTARVRGSNGGGKRFAFARVEYNLFQGIDDGDEPSSLSSLALAKSHALWRSVRVTLPDR